MKDETIDNYLKTIYRIAKRKGSVAGVDIADELFVSKPTACLHVKHLQTEGYVRRDSTKGIMLTKTGLARAEKVIARYEFFLTLLTALGVSQSAAEQDACRLEHAVCPESFGALKAYLKLKKT